MFWDIRIGSTTFFHSHITINSTPWSSDHQHPHSRIFMTPSQPFFHLATSNTLCPPPSTTIPQLPHPLNSHQKNSLSLRANLIKNLAVIPYSSMTISLSSLRVSPTSLAMLENPTFLGGYSAEDDVAVFAMGEEED